MPRIRFTADFDFHVKHNVIIAYKAGKEYPVTRRCAQEAKDKGAAVVVRLIDEVAPAASFVPTDGAEDAAG